MVGISFGKNKKSENQSNETNSPSPTETLEPKPAFINPWTIQKDWSEVLQKKSTPKKVGPVRVGKYIFLYQHLMKQFQESFNLEIECKFGNFTVTGKPILAK